MKRRTKIIIGSSLLLIGGTALFFYFRNRKKNREKSSDASQITTTPNMSEVNQVINQNVREVETNRSKPSSKDLKAKTNVGLVNTNLIKDLQNRYGVRSVTNRIISSRIILTRPLPNNFESRNITVHFKVGGNQRVSIKDIINSQTIDVTRIPNVNVDYITLN